MCGRYWVCCVGKPWTADTGGGFTPLDAYQLWTYLVAGLHPGPDAGRFEVEVIRGGKLAP